MITTQELLAETVEEARRRERAAWPDLQGADGGSLIFGAGTLGRKLLAAMRKEGAAPLAFTDNDARRHGSSVDGIPVVSPAEAARTWGAQALFLGAIFRPDGEGMEARLKQLRTLGGVRTVSFLPAAWFFSAALPHFGADLPSRLLAHATELAQIDSMWADGESRETFRQQLRWRLRGEFDGIAAPKPDQYFPRDVIAPAAVERFVDGGAFDGDTLRSAPWSLQQVWAFEPDPATAAKLRETNPGAVEVHETLLGHSPGRARFDASGTMASARSEDGGMEIPIVTLDDVLAGESPTFLKLDVEGDELAALKGGRHMLRRAQPIVAVCLYHRPEDLWTIPLFLRDLLPGHRFYLRSHARDGFELVTYAVPESRCVHRR